MYIAHVHIHDVSHVYDVIQYMMLALVLFFQMYVYICQDACNMSACSFIVLWSLKVCTITIYCGVVEPLLYTARVLG